MNIKITHNWLLEYLETEATPEEIQKYVSLCGPSIEQVEKVGNDYVYNIEVTSNRVDTASVAGIAREAATILSRFGIKAKLKQQTNTKTQVLPTNLLSLTIADPNKLCKRILAVVMDNISIKPSPEYIQQRLTNVGIRALNNVVDITNYVMTEVGHPAHVFDYDRIKTHKLIIRHAKNGEGIVTLDEKKYQLSNDDIIIDDGTGRVIDLPGIMGTANSVVTADTKRIIFFIESNDPVAIRRSSMRYGIRTMAATINEKNPDPEIALAAFWRGIELYQKIVGAKPAGKIIDIYKEPKSVKAITTTFDFINKKIGIEISQSQIIKILEDLGFIIEVNDQTFKAIVPTYRTGDISIPEDLVEEVARIYGYDNFPGIVQPTVYIKQPKEEESLFVYSSKIKYFLKHLGLTEVMNYSMISKKMIEDFDLKVSEHLKIINSISKDIEYLRTHLTASLVKNIKDNEDKKEELRFFELAKTYKAQKDDLPIERFKLGIVVNTDFSDLKGIIDAVMNELNIKNFKIEKNNCTFFSENQQGKIVIDEEKIAQFGQLKSLYKNRADLKSDAYIVVFDFQDLISHFKLMPLYKQLHPYSVIKLDLTMELNKNLTYEKIKEISFKISKYLEKLEFISLYKNKLSLRFYFSLSSRNLTEEEAKEELKKIEKTITDNRGI